MKKLIIAAAFILIAGVAFGQTLQKGSILGVHLIEVTLDPDVTYNQWKNFVLNTYLPAYNEGFQGDVEFYYTKVDRGDDENGIGIMYAFKSVEVRAKYFTPEGTVTELFTSMDDKIMLTIADEMSKLGTSNYTRLHYNDWLIQ
jgi:hypothetical protein